jgi:DNA-binding HxlR family transcriptional regulator
MSTPTALADSTPRQSTERCPVEATFDIIGGKWKPLIVHHLLSGTKRFSELQRAIPSVTRRMLTEHLRELEADGIVHREVYRQVPPKVEYSLTPAGLALKPVLDQILTWGVWYLRQASTPPDPSERG